MAIGGLGKFGDEASFWMTMQMRRSHPVFDVIEVSFLGDGERVLHSVPSRDEADRLVAELSVANARPATFFYWVTRRR